MRSVLLPVLAAACLGGCTIRVPIPTDPDLHSLDPKALSHLRQPQVVSLINGYTSEAKEELDLGTSVMWVFDVRQFSETAIVMLKRALEAQGITSAPDAGKSVSITIFGMRGGVRAIPPYARINAEVYLLARYGDGTESGLWAANHSPLTQERAFGGALLFALNKLVIDDKFVAYMNK